MEFYIPLVGGTNWLIGRASECVGGSNKLAGGANDVVGKTIKQ